MKQLQRVFALCFTFVILVSCLTTTVFAAGETTVNFRLVLSRYTSYASCSVFLNQYESMTSEDIIATKQISVGRVELWEREVPLEPGYYQVASVSILGSWEAMDAGSTERFEVKGDKMTVYVAVDTPDKPAQLPPQWLVYGEDNQKFHLWDDNPNLIPGDSPDTTEPDDTDPPTTVPGEDLPDDPDTGTEEDPDGPNHGTQPVPNNPTTPEKPEEPVKDSVRIGNIVFYAIIGLIFVICFILLRKIQKERGA